MGNRVLLTLLSIITFVPLSISCSEDPVLRKISITIPSTRYILGETSSVQLSASGFDQNDDPIPINDLSWSSSHPSIVSVDSNGLATFIKEGEVNIIATSGGVSEEIGLTIIAPVEIEMLVSSRNTHSVKRFDAKSGIYLDDLIPPGSGGLNTTQDIQTAPDDNILVSGRGNSSILLFDKTTGNFIGPFTSGYDLDNPTKISFGPDGNLYVSQWGESNSKIVRFDPSGQFLDEFTDNLNQPLDHIWDAQGNFYVACFGSKDVRVFDENGKFQNILAGSGHLEGPTNLWFDEDGNLLVVDWNLGSILQFDVSSGAFIKTLVSGLTHAEGFAVGPEDNLFVCDWSENEIIKFTPEGNLIGVFTNEGEMKAPNSLLFRKALN